MSVEDNRARCLSKIVSLMKFLIPDYRGLSVQKRWFSYFFILYSKMAPRIFQIFCMSVEGNRVHWLCKIVFLKKFLIPDYRGLSFQKWCFSYFFGLYSKTALRIFQIFCMSVEDKREQDCFSEKNGKPGLKGIQCPKKVFLTYLAVTPEQLLRIVIIFCMSVMDNRAHCLKQSRLCIF